MIHDLRHALRTITRAPLLSAVIVLSLGIGIGVNTVVFAWLQSTIVHPLPGVPGAGAFISSSRGPTTIRIRECRGSSIAIFTHGSHRCLI